MRVLAVALAILLMWTTPSAAFAVHTNGPTWGDFPYQSWKHYVRYRLQSGWPGGDNGNQARMVSHGRWQWNECNRELHFPWAPMGQANRRIDVSYEDLAPPYTSYWAVTFPEAFYIDGKIASMNIAINSQPDGKPAHTWLYWGSATNIPNDKIDSISLTVHEFGHTIVLYHTQNTADVMYEFLDENEVARALSAHDIDSFEDQYPPKTSGAPSCPPP